MEQKRVTISGSHNANAPFNPSGMLRNRNKSVSFKAKSGQGVGTVGFRTVQPGSIGKPLKSKVQTKQM